MLVGFATATALVLSVVVCLAGGAFAGLSWLWMLPLSFAGIWLVLALAILLFLVIVSYIVDLDKEQEDDDPFYRRVAELYAEALIQIMQVRVRTRGLEKTPTDGRFLLVCNHQFLADPGVLLHHFKDSQLAFISKKENRDLFCVGRIMHKFLCQTLDRDNDRQALKTILKCIQLIREDKVSVAVFPEGGTNHDDKLHPLKAGVFKIAQKAEVPIVVCTINNTRPVFKNAAKLRKTDVQLHLVGVIPAEELKGRTTVDIAEQVYGMMLSDLGEEYRYIGQETEQNT